MVYIAQQKLQKTADFSYRNFQGLARNGANKVSNPVFKRMIFSEDKEYKKDEM